MKKLFAWMLALTMCLSLLAGCAKEEEKLPDVPAPDSGKEQPVSKPEDKKPEKKPEKPAEPKIYYWTDGYNADSVNPVMSGTQANGDMTTRLSGRLFRSFPAENGTKSVYEPELAAELPKDKNGDGMVWILTVHPEAKWQNGEPITADDFLYGWHMALEPKLAWVSGAWVGENYATVLNGPQYHTQTAENPVKWEDVGFKKIDDRTIEVTLSARATQYDVIRHFASNYTAPIYQPLYEKCMAADGASNDYGTSVDKFMASGPFLLERWVKGAEAMMKKNPMWVRADMIKLDGIFRREVVDEATRLELFEKGQSDTITLGPNGMAKYGEDPRVLARDTVTIRSIEFNQNNPDKPYLADPMFRKAFFCAVDRNTMAGLTHTSPAPYFLSSLDIVYQDGTLYRELPGAKKNVAPNGGYDPEQAKKLFDEVMKKYNQTKITLNLFYNENIEAVRMMSEYLQGSLPKIFGADRFELTLTSLPAKVMLKTMRSSQNEPTTAWELSWSHWGLGGEVENPWKKFAKYTSTDSTRYTHYTSDRIDDLYAKMRSDDYRFDEKKMAELYVEAEGVLLEEMLVCPIVQTRSHMIYAERVQLPMKQYRQGVGWGAIYCDLDMSK